MVALNLLLTFTTFTTLWGNSADAKLIIFIFPRKQAPAFHAHCLHDSRISCYGDNLHEMWSLSSFWKKNTETISKCRLSKLLPSMLGVQPYIVYIRFVKSCVPFCNKNCNYINTLEKKPPIVALFLLNTIPLPSLSVCLSCSTYKQKFK